MQTSIIETNTNTPESTHLTLISAHPRRTLEIKEYLVLGRDTSCGWRIEDDFVSTRHARIEKRNQSFVIKDLRSRNGTWVNNVKVLEAELSHMDRVVIGETHFVFTHYKLESQNNLNLKSKNPAWSKQIEKIPSMANTNHPVLILGESGSGKEVLAHAIHANSRRRQAPFISVNCSALTETLVESELFGHIKGSFTGAISDRKGAFESARGGTLFLDEIGDLPLTLQPKLLRALENNEIKPVGGDRNIPIDVRIVAATNQNIQKQIQDGRFRQDLYFRLHILQVTPPALRDRMEDFDDLFHNFADPLRVRFTSDALKKIRLHNWPGNIRELKNVIARAAALFPDQSIKLDDTDYLIDKNQIESSNTAHYPLIGYGRGVMKEFEKELIVERLLANAGNQRKTAIELGIPKSTLHDRIKIYGIDVKTLRADSNDVTTSTESNLSDT